MGFRIEERSETVVQQKLAIVVDGEDIGWVEETPGQKGRWFCHITFDSVADFHHGLLMGYGETVEEAIHDAFKRSAEKAERYLEALDALGLKMFAEKEVHHG